MLVNSRQQERLALNFAESLTRIGVRARVRLVDDVQYWRRLSKFDFDMVQSAWSASTSPGNEQRNRWSSAAAGREGSLNYAGAASPAIDRMIDALLIGQGAGRISSPPSARSTAPCSRASTWCRFFTWAINGLPVTAS